MHLLQERLPRGQQQRGAVEEQELWVFVVGEDVVHQTQPVVLSQQVCEQRLQKGPGIYLGSERISSKMCHQLGVLNLDDLFDGTHDN